MRIITGKARNIPLKTLEGDATRPTSERVKEAVFSMLQFEIEGRRVLDLFAAARLTRRLSTTQERQAI